MSEPQLIHHQINYIEIYVTDMLAAKKFYADAFGWSFNEYGPEYTGIRKMDDHGEVGGIAVVENVAAGGPLVILYSSDLETSLASVETAGGTICKPIFSFPGGRRFEFNDPSGNRLAVWSDQ